MISAILLQTRKENASVILGHHHRRNIDVGSVVMTDRGGSPRIWSDLLDAVGENPPGSSVSSESYSLFIYFNMGLTIGEEIDQTKKQSAKNEQNN